MPLRWLAPEVLLNKKFTTATDVYAFGIFAIECFSQAALPFADLEDSDVIRLLLPLARSEVEQPTIDVPEGCPEKLVGIIQACISNHHSARPSFLQISTMAQDISVKTTLGPGNEPYGQDSHVSESRL